MSLDYIDTTKLIKGALVFSAALALNSTMSETLEILYPLKSGKGPKNALIARWTYFAFVIITILIILFIFNRTVDLTNKISGKSVDRREVVIHLKNNAGEHLKTKSISIGSK